MNLSNMFHKKVYLSTKGTQVHDLIEGIDRTGFDCNSLLLIQIAQQASPPVIAHPVDLFL